MKKNWTKWLMTLAAFGVMACGQGNSNAEKPSAAPAKPVEGTAPQAKVVHVVSSFSVLGDVVKAIGGERVQVDNLVGINQDPHVYQPSPQDVQKIGKAKVFVINGLGYEGWLERLEGNSGFSGVKIVATDGVKPLAKPAHGEEGHDHEHDHDEHDHGAVDPHVWLDPKLVAQYYVPNIVKGLSQADPEGANYYQQQAQAYTNQLNQLSTQIQQSMDRFPRDQRNVVVSHRAFEYFGKSFGITFHALQGVSTESQPSAKQVAELIKEIKEEHIKAVFAENITDPKMIQQIAAETGVTVGKSLYSESVSDETGVAPTYLRMMQYNADQIAAGLSK